ncbi:MAG: polysaccharide deacetylase family protein [Endomicrobiales bacterium]
MFKINLSFVIYRYELILAMIVLLLTGSVVVSSRDRQEDLPAPSRYCPYRIALTFDDGPHPYYTDRLITVLEKENVKASFFLVGRLAVQYPELVQHLSLAGHELDVHTFTHRNLARLSGDEVRRELSLTARVIEGITKRRTVFFRPPGGQYDAKVLAAASATGQHMVLWTVFPKDHEENDPDVIVQKVLAQASDGGVVLLHSGRDATLEALPRIITALRQKGYAFVTVSQLAEKQAPGQLARLKVAPEKDRLRQ